MPPRVPFLSTTSLYPGKAPVAPDSAHTLLCTRGRLWLLAADVTVSFPDGRKDVRKGKRLKGSLRAREG